MIGRGWEKYDISICAANERNNNVSGMATTGVILFQIKNLLWELEEKDQAPPNVHYHPISFILGTHWLYIIYLLIFLWAFFSFEGEGTQWCSEVTPDSALRNYSWWCSKDYKGWQVAGGPCAKQAPYPWSYCSCTSFPISNIDFSAVTGMATGYYPAAMEKLGILFKPCSQPSIHSVVNYCMWISSKSGMFSSKIVDTFNNFVGRMRR